MRDIQIPGGSNINRGSVNAANNISAKNIIPIEQAKKFVAPPQQPKREYFQPRPNNSSKKYLALGLFLSLVIISIIFFLATFAFDGATITIKPLIRKDLGLNESFIVSELDRKDLLLSQNVRVEEFVTVPKKSVKKVFRKAEGEVIIYNNFSKDPQKFVKGTRLSTTDGKVFRTLKEVLIPGKVGNQPGQIKVMVQADMDGNEYNIGPTKFTIPGLKATPKFKDFYAESSSTMKGGASGNSNEVSDADLQKALADMKTKLVESAQEKFATDIPEGFVYNKQSMVLDAGKMTKSSEDENTATYTQVATATTLFFKRDEIVKRILSQPYVNSISKPIVKLLDTSKLEIGVSNQTEALNENTQVTLTVTGPAPAIFYPNKQDILEYYAGRPVSEFNDLNKKFQFTMSAKRTLYPFWNSYFPTNISKINIVFEE